MKKTIAKLLSLALAGTAVAGLSVTAYAEEDHVITVAASPTPHAEILEKAAELLEEEGWTLEITEFTDYVQPNLVVDEGEILANYFQHTPYLESFNEEQGTDLVSVAKIHYEPMGIYVGTKSSIDDLEDGDTIAVPNDTTNEARALLLLEANGVLTLPEDADLTVTANDVVSFKDDLDIEIIEVEAAQVAQYVDEVAFCVVNGNYALSAGLSSSDALAFESSDSEAAQTYANVVVVKAGNEENEGVQALVEVLQSDEIKDFITETYDGSVVPYEESAEEAETEAAETEAVTE
ncbi:MAG: MetQ/NlpA family ABC transporter substrate-binding protein [Lachnospiraceae bacterium]|nr:MetQ/NlpA family ABC transporter substrate-binding protein [Lachnospiraceae bacterium]